MSARPTVSSYLLRNRPWWLAASSGYVSGLRGQDRRRRGIRVICYHGVVERKQDRLLERNFQLLSDFRSQVSLLRRFRVLSLDELSQELSSPSDGRRPKAVITFDDGYANNLLAAEVLDKARLPWSVFATTATLGRDKALWTVELSLLLLQGQANSIEVLDHTWPLGTNDEREVAFQGIRYPLKVMSAAARRQAMDSIRHQFPAGETPRLISQFPSLQMLGWEELRQLSSSGVEVGSHGVMHEIHHMQQPDSVRMFELCESKLTLEQHLGRPCIAFAFPNGNFNPSSANEIVAAGYKIAFTTQVDTFLPHVHRHMVPRLSPVSSIRQFSKSLFWATEPADDGV